MATAAKEMDATNLAECEKTCVVSSSFLESIKSLLDEGTSSDVILRIGSKSFPVHKCILSARSPVFKAMFNGNFKQKIVVDIPDLDEDTMRELMSYIYTDTIGKLQWQGALDLYRAADKYELLDLMRRCGTLLKSSLSVSNICVILAVADMHRDQELRGAAQGFVMQQGADFFTSDAWRNFKKENSELAWEIVEPILCNKNSRIGPNKGGTSEKMESIASNNLQRFPYNPSLRMQGKSNSPSSAYSMQDTAGRPKYGSKKHWQNQMNKFQDGKSFAAVLEIDNFVDANYLYKLGREKSGNFPDNKPQKHFLSMSDQCENSMDIQRRLIPSRMQSQITEHSATTLTSNHCFLGNSAVVTKRYCIADNNNGLRITVQNEPEISPVNKFEKNLSPKSYPADSRRRFIQPRIQPKKKNLLLPRPTLITPFLGILPW